MAGLALVAVLMAGLAFWGSSNATDARNQAATAEAASTLAVEREEDAQQQAATAQAASTLAVSSEATAQAERDRAEEQARIARANELSALGNSYFDTEIDLGLLLSVKAFQLESNNQTRSSLSIPSPKIA